ncbi:MAG TPA: ATP-binding cassette domain-containing protein [Candidatus Dormibacteraeota bacterium]|nr:ATP-binding cassette domain-containing protein [Candidatus Dormibacteraeota bacterium]
MRTRGGSPLYLLAGLLLLYLAVPVVAFAVRAAGSAQQLWSAELAAALAVSLETASVSTLVIAVLGVPLAYLLARSQGHLATAAGFVVQLPLALPPLASGIFLLYVVGPYTPLGQLFGGQLTDTRIGIVLAQTFVAAPFAVIAARSAFAALDPGLEDVAATLGHRRWSRFLRVALPAAAPGIGAGLLLSWLRAFGEYGATVLLAYYPYSLPVFTYVQFTGTGLKATLGPAAFGLAAALGVLVMATLAGRLRLPHAVPRPLPEPMLPPARPGPRLAFDLDASIDHFQLQVSHRLRGHHLAILGPSGAGKTFTLRLLAGLASGRTQVLVDGRDLAGLPPEERGIGYVPQDACLVPSLPVWRQVILGPRSDPRLAAHWLEQLHLDGLEGRRPDQLSGGQRRRVALARALAASPRLLLLDEPFTGLDAPIRAELRSELRQLQRESQLTTVLVTHDPEEAAMLADEVLVLSDGRPLQAGAQAEVFRAPCSPAVARLLGFRNLLPGRLTDPGSLQVGGFRLDICPVDSTPGSLVTWSIRPEAVRVGRGSVVGRVVDRIELGGQVELAIELEGGPTITARTERSVLDVGQTCRLELPASEILVWPLPPRQ